MTYEEFINEIIAMAQRRMGDEAHVCLHTIYKNNNLKRNALCILENGSNVSPTIYLEPYYSLYQKGEEPEQILEMILSEYQTNRCGLYLNVDEFQDFKTISPRIVYKLLNYERNRELLKDVPHRKFLDLAVTYCFLIENPFLGSGTAMIHAQQLNSWNITEEDLYRLSCQNTDRLLGNEIASMEEVIREMLKKDLLRQMSLQTECDKQAEEQAELMSGQILDSLLPSGRYSMYVISNRDKYYGASAVLNHKKLSGFAAAQGCGFYVIPSSIHEMILIPETQNLNASELKQLLHDINLADVETQEFLSQNVYYFDRQADRLIL